MRHTISRGAERKLRNPRPEKGSRRRNTPRLQALIEGRCAHAQVPQSRATRITQVS